MELIYNIGLILFGLAGAFLSGYIAKQKNHGEHLVCPLGHSCDAIINGKYSKFFGLRVEKIGLAYYILVTLFYIGHLIFTFPQTAVFAVMLVTGISFVFSVHLLATQLFLIKKWCTLCIGSAAISFMILVMTFLGFESNFGAYLFEYSDILGWLFGTSVLVGVISSTLHARTFIKFLKDFEISKRESGRLAMFGHVGWVAITLAFLSGLALVLTDIYGNVTEGVEFNIIIMILGVLIVYEVIVNMVLGPKLIDVHFGDHPELDDHKHMMMRKNIFSFIAVGIISWYSLLVLITVSFYGYSTIFLVLMYLALIVIGVVVALFAENIYYKKSLYLKEEE